MRHHNIEHCPVTDKPNPGGFTWTDHAKDGSLNSCPQCCPDGFVSIGQALHDLQAKRLKENQT